MTKQSTKSIMKRSKLRNGLEIMLPKVLTENNATYV